MLNKVCAFIASHKLIAPGDRVVCAVSGGADSVALLWAMYLLRDKLNITVEAAHYNHGLRGEESDRDQQFVVDFCHRYDIPLHLGCGEVKPGEKGLEAAARDARYRFFDTIPGKIATAHTADDNGETVLMHLLRGTGLKGLGGIAPKRNNLIRPMLSVTRDEVLAFLEEYCLTYVEDSSNHTDRFLRNRIRHHVMPLLRAENPAFAENVSAMALRLREDEQVLQSLTKDQLPDVDALREMAQPIRHRYLANFLEKNGVSEPNAEHILLADSLVFSENPSAKGSFPGGVQICREYDRLVKMENVDTLQERKLPCPGTVEYPRLGLRVLCEISEKPVLTWERFRVYPKGNIVVRHRKAGDTIRLHGGVKSLKELFIDRKIPASQRMEIPVVADELGVLGVWGIGANLERITGSGEAVNICFEEIESSSER